MGEPTVEVKQEAGVVTKKKLEAESEDAPDAKKMKIEAADAEQPAAADSNGTTVKTENGANGAESKTAEERGDPDLKRNLVRQIEYYFGDINLPKDKFLQEQVKLEDGWIPLEVMLRFQRLAQLSKNPATIVSFLKTDSKLIEVNEDGTKIRRSPDHPLPDMNEEWHKARNERTVYCKGFPQSEQDMNCYLKFFDQYGPVDNIHLRRYQEKPSKTYKFKGTAYILFETKELAEKFLALESVKFEGQELIRMTFAAHNEEKKKEKDERWGKKVKKEGAASEEKAKPKKEFAKGCILKINDIMDEELSREVIKSTLVDLGADVAFIQYAKGEKEALVRLHSLEDGAAVEFVKKLNEENKKVKFGDVEMEVSPVEGEEEEAFLQKSREQMEQRNNKRGRGNNRHRGGRGGFQRNRRGRNSD